MTWQVGGWIVDPPSQSSHRDASMTLIHVDGLTDPAAPVAEGSDGILLPRERELLMAREADRSGIPMPADVRTKIREAAD